MQTYFGIFTLMLINRQQIVNYTYRKNSKPNVFLEDFIAHA